MEAKAKKSLGQNFLKDPEVLRSIVDIAEIHPGDRVFEIGPGTGALTEVLSSAGAHVLAVELDRELVSRLSEHFIASDNVSILEGNILDMHLFGLLVFRLLDMSISSTRLLRISCIILRRRSFARCSRSDRRRRRSRSWCRMRSLIGSLRRPVHSRSSP